MTSKKMKIVRHLSLVLAVVMMLTALNLPSMTAMAAEESGIGGFVNRCYQVTLGRDADPDGYADWTGRLTNGQIDGADVAFGFVFSDEYLNANKSNGDFVTDMYMLFLGRVPDEDGYNDWVGQLDAGADRVNIFAGFANSVEFFNICVDYGVTAGAFSADYDHTRVNNVNMFVARLYGVCLNRLGDQNGQADWVGKLLRGELTGIDCAYNFINSQEYQNLGLSNDAYVRNMYRAFMGREADETGFNDWVSKLNAGYTRDEIFAGFANSEEFQSICDSYGIARGTYVAQDVHTGEIVVNNESATENDNQSENTQGRFRLVKESNYYSNNSGGKPSGYTEYVYDGIDDEHPRRIIHGWSSTTKEEYVNVTDDSYVLKLPTSYSVTCSEYKKLSDQKFHEVKRWFAETEEASDMVMNFKWSDGPDVKLLSERTTCEKYGWYKVGTYTYDQNGNRIHYSVIEYSKDGTKKNQMDYSYEYNGPGGQISFEKKEYEGKPCYDTKYIYNGTQLETEYYHHVWTPESDDFNNATEYTDYYQYEYDEHGNLVKKTRYEYSSWEKEYVAEDCTIYEYEAY